MNLEDCACTQIVESFPLPLKYPPHKYLADFGILASTIIIYSIGKKVYKKITNL